MNKEEIKERIRDIFGDTESLNEICDISNIITNECRDILNKAIEERR